MEQSNHQEKRLYAIAKLTSRLKKNWKIRAVAEIETDEEVKKNYRNIQWEGRKFVVTLKDNSGEIEAVAFKFAAKFESQIQNNKEYYVSGARIEKANKGFQEKHKYHLILDENALFQACSSGAASVGSTSTAMSTPQKVQFQPRTVNEAQTIGTSEHFDILGIVKKLYAAEPKHNKKSGARFYSKQVCVADKTGEVIISFSGEKAKHLDPLKKMKNQIIGVVGCHWATEKKDLLYASSNDVYEGRNMPAHVISKVRELRQWWEASGKPRPSAAKGKSDASPEKRGTKRTHEEQEHGSDSLNGCSGPSDLKMKKMNFKKFESLTKIGRDAFQFYFDTKFPPQDFSKFLMDNKDTMQYGRGGSKFTDEQMDVLFPAKDRLFNDVVGYLKEHSVGFPSAMSNDVITKNVMILVNCLWYMDGQAHKIMGSRAATEEQTQENAEQLERLLEKFKGYNDWKKKKMKAPALQRESLCTQSNLVFGLLTSPFTFGWGKVKQIFEYLALRMNSYADYLEKQCEEQKARHELEHPPRQVAEDAYLQNVSHTDTVGNAYRLLDTIMSQLDLYEFLFFDEGLHIEQPFKNRGERFSFLQDLKLSVPINVLRYDPGGDSGATIFLWRIPKERAHAEVMNMTMKVVERLKSRLPEYHSRRMKREFIKRYCSLQQSIPKHILREIYHTATMDSSADQNPQMDERVRQAIQSEDSDLVMDLRHLNKGRPNDTYNTFFEILSAKVEEITAADERRHNIAHMSRYVSVRDLIEDVRKEVGENVPIPSESTVLFAFAPKNAYLHTARLYKSRIGLKFQVQTRQLRMSHQDDHYCSALFKYMRGFAVKFREQVSFISIDDKSKIDIGEPRQFIATGVRGKKSLIPVTSQLSAMDHDVMSKGSITPSVCLHVDLPEEKDGTFYRGEVTVAYKDSVLQASSPIRHTAELQKMLQEKETVNPVLMIFSDGGPDHRLTYHSVKLALIILFKNLDLDQLIACRTAPGHSWINPVERIMSTLNLAIQNVSLAREECSSDKEQILRGCNSMADIRKKAESNPSLKDEWLGSLTTIMDTLESRTSRLSLKGVPFKCMKPATDESIKSIETQIKQDVDPNIVPGKYQQKDLSSKQAYMTFLDKHTIQRHYMFQVRKCDNRECCGPLRGETMPDLPDPIRNGDHYKPLEEVLGTETTERDRPSKANQTVAAVAEEIQGCKNNVLTAQNVRQTVKCLECQKPRCIYAKKALSMRESRGLTRLLERHHYTCGSLITPDGKKSTATSSKLDVTIMYKLLRNYGIDIPSPTKDWGKKPDIGQKLIGDDLERIRSYRNKVNHATEETNVMDDDNSFMWWNDLKQAIVRLSGGRLKKEIEDLETSTF